MKKPIANITNIFHIVNTLAVLIYISIQQKDLIFQCETLNHPITYI